MEIRTINPEYLEACVNIAKEQYNKEKEMIPEIETKTYIEELRNNLTKACEKSFGAVCLDKGTVCGYLICQSRWEEDGIQNIFIPVWGHGAAGDNRTAIMAQLFSYFAEQVCKEGTIHFEIKTYAHDIEIIRYFVMTQFGIQCSDTVRASEEQVVVTCKVSPVLEGKNITYQEFTKEQIEVRKEEVLSLYRRLVHHLEKSPVFYPGTEFTDEVYMGYIMDADTRLFTAMDGERVIGIIDAAIDSGCFLLNDQETYCVGDIFVEEAYRRNGVAASLLGFVNDTLRKEGVNRLWVEHGTANSNAVGFWDRYFKPFTYTLIRDIMSIKEN